MKPQKPILIRLAMFVALSFAIGLMSDTSYGQGSVYSAGERPGKAIGSAYVSLDADSLQFAGNNPVLSVFIQTGSKSQICLTSLNESNAVPIVETIWCGKRKFHHQNGVKVLIDLTQPPQGGFVVEFTLYHEGAKFYGQPKTYPWHL